MQFVKSVRESLCGPAENGEAAARMNSINKMFLKISENLQENLNLQGLPYLASSLRPATLLKKDSVTGV